MTRRVSDEERAELRREFMQDIRDAADKSEDFEGFKDRLEGSDPSLPGLTRSEIAAMSEDEINANWPAVSRVLAEGDAGDLRAPQSDPPPPGRLATGQQLRSESGPDRTPLNLQTIKGMTTDEINSRWSEVQAVLQGGR